MLINYIGKFIMIHRNNCHHRVERPCSLGSLKTKEMYLKTETMLTLFDAYVGSVLNYWCEMWVFHNGKNVEIVQLQYLKTLLKITTDSAVVYCETCRFPLKTVRLFRNFKF